ncbi:hypothetical protein SI65_09929 [Aspergillus cristatus]|uniref:Uncharacterized protein n=1 Tax=Aspergillus cristatus TaxID=573508 RepID=A0A1E3B0Y3_ASPCR|nr:hypothetical protein SI65_09929 [Aspergillus cristatus]
MLKEEPLKKQTPKKEVTVKTYLEDDVRHNHAQFQGCCCGKHLPESNTQQQASQVKPQKRVPQPPQPPKASYQRGRHPFYKKPALPQTPDLPRYAQPVKLIWKQEQDQPQNQQAQKPDKKQVAKLKSQKKPQEKLQLPKDPTQDQLRRYRLERFYTECENPLQTQELPPNWAWYPYISRRVQQDEDQGKPPLEKDRLVHKKDSPDLPQEPGPAYRGRRPFDSDVQMSTSRIQPPQERPQQQTWESNYGVLTTMSSRASSGVDENSNDEWHSVMVHLTEEYRKMSLQIADIMAYECRPALS